MNAPVRPCRISWIARTALFAAAAFSLLAGTARPAQAKLRVVTTIETFADLARRVGGAEVEVSALGRGTMDPHFVEAKPSLQVLLNRADLLIHVGLDLEIGWLPPLLVGARNANIQPGTLGNLDASAGIPVLDQPTTKVDRSMGDIHPMGNPHYWVPPDNAVIVATAIANRLTQLDPSHAKDFQANLARFQADVAAHKAAWAKQAEGVRGLKVVTYHRSWIYVSHWLGLDEVGYIEPKPGIPPAPSHIFTLVTQMKAQKVREVIVESFYSRQTADRVAQVGGAKLVVLPSDVGARPDVKDYFSLVDAVVKGVVDGAK